MPKRVIVLEKLTGPRPAFRMAFWADVPLARQIFYANPAAISAYKDATTAEVALIKTGAVVERVEVVSADPPRTAAQMQAIAEGRWTAFQAEIEADNPWSRYGSSWDGTAWITGGVA